MKTEQTVLYAHTKLHQEVDSLAGYYIIKKEAKIRHNSQELFYVVGHAVVESSCCGQASFEYVNVIGYVVKWQFKTNKNGFPVSRIQPINDESLQTEIKETIRNRENIDIIYFF